MIDLSIQPLGFDAANEWLRSRVNVGTALGSRELALQPDFDARVRAHAFFSARVEEANVLDAIRAELEQFGAGGIDLATARVRAKLALTRLGYAADDVGMADEPPAGIDEETWKARRQIANLASTRRLDLILTQNARMGWAAGRRQVSLDPAVKQRWPNFRYIARDDGATRPDHKALDGMVLPKDDPFWHTHTPPWAFHCRCDIEDSDAPATGRAVVRENPDGTQQAVIDNPAAGAAGAGVQILPPESGFVFRADEAFGVLEMSRIRNIPMRGAVMQRLRRLARQHQAKFNCVLKNALEGRALGDADRDTAERLITDAAEAVRAGRPLPRGEAQIGRLSEELRAALGLESDVVMLGGGSVGRDASAYGFQHQITRHREQLLDGTMAAALRETVFSAGGAVAQVGFNGGTMYLLIANRETTAVSIMYRHGDRWQVASADRRGETFIKRMGGIFR